MVFILGVCVCVGGGGGREFLSMCTRRLIPHKLNIKSFIKFVVIRWRLQIDEVPEKEIHSDYNKNTQKKKKKKKKK